jgi:hypothetical protein
MDRAQRGASDMATPSDGDEGALTFGGFPRIKGAT